MTAHRQHEQITSQTTDQLDRQLTTALEAVPHIAVPDDFAARVMSRVPAPQIAAQSLPSRASIGRRVAIVAAMVLVIAMIVFAAPTHGANQLSRTSLLWTVAAEFVALTAWLAMRPGEQN